MERTGADISARIATVTPARRRRDAELLIEMMRRVSGLEPESWSGGIIGFGEYEYRYDSGHEGCSPALGFAPRKPATTIYLADGIGAYADELARLGPHTTGVGCLYLKDLDQVELTVLEQILTASFTTLTAGTYDKRAREGGR